MAEPERLFTANEVAKMLGVSRKWIHSRLTRYPAAPAPDFSVNLSGKDLVFLWTEKSLGRWQAFYASEESIPKSGKFFSYSDHQAVNRFRDNVVTWKLWWRAVPGGKTEWWFSTPAGWWTSEDDGRSWVDTGLLVRPTGFRYICVNGNSRPSSATAAVLRSALQLRHKLDVNTYDKV